jgi:CheY-like chemotaxis protein
VIFLDVNLPDCSTELLIDLIRSDEGNINQTAPIILTSSWLTDASKRNYLTLGVNEVYIKPIKEKDFKRILINYGIIN